MTNVLVTGARGFIARHLAAALRGLRARCIGIDLAGGSVEGFDDVLRVDLTDAAATRKAIETVRPRLLFHLAGALQGSRDDLHRANAGTTATLLAAVQAYPDVRVLVVGSAAEYGVVPRDRQPVDESFHGAPTTAYGLAKARVVELALNAHATFAQDVVIVRPFNVIGPGTPATLAPGAIVARVRAALATDPPGAVRVGRTDSVRDFVAVQDVARGMALAARMGRAGEIYNLCTGVGRTISELVDTVFRCAGTRLRLEHDAAISVTGDVDAMVGSPAKAARELNWQPSVSFEDSIAAMWQAAARDR